MVKTIDTCLENRRETVLTMGTSLGNRQEMVWTIGTCLGNCLAKLQPFPIKWFGQSMHV